VYNRELDGTVLTLGASGWTYVYTFVLFDQETNSMWLPLNIGEIGDICGCALFGITGPHAGRRLATFPTEYTQWNIWYALHPDTKILKDPDAD
jgi:hypothetical protein